MKFLTNQMLSINQKTTERVYSPYYMARNIWGGRIVGERERRNQGIPSYLGLSYKRVDLRAGVYYPKPLHLIVRLFNWFDYWSYLPMG